MKNEATDDHIKAVIRKRKCLCLFDTKLNWQATTLGFLASTSNHFLGPINPHNMSSETRTLHDLYSKISCPTTNIQHAIPIVKGKQVNHPFTQLPPTTNGDALE